ncbi:MAG: COX15/CtaA family protein [Steroidobacteraceae bacterium]|nr:COX15/CtaA family protein [Steroidobacteraceae bacterium]
MTLVRRLALTAMLLCLGVVVLGAYVRLSAAGLGCPDWPGCYGHVTPTGALANDALVQQRFPGAEIDAGKAWREMIHRYAASTLGLLIVVIAGIAIATRKARQVPLGLPIALVVVVVFQGILGMLTVTWLLKPLIVTAHLVFGLTTLALLSWLWLTLRPRGADSDAPRIVRRWALVGIAALTLQIVLGGWTSSNYAAMACPDFPTCQASWWPSMDFRDAFVLWHGLGINYEGGVLDHPARVAIHFVHRLGAVVAALALLVAAGTALWRVRRPGAVRAAVFVIAALALQLAIGIFMIWRGFPLWLATAHNAGAALLLLAAVLLNRRVRA